MESHWLLFSCQFQHHIMVAQICNFFNHSKYLLSLSFLSARLSSLLKFLWMAAQPSGLSDPSLSLASLHLLRVQSIPLSGSVMKKLNITCPGMSSWGTPAVTDLSYGSGLTSQSVHADYSQSPSWWFGDQTFLIVLEMASRIICPITFQGIQVRLTSQFPGSSFWPSWRQKSLSPQEPPLTPMNFWR